MSAGIDPYWLRSDEYSLGRARFAPQYWEVVGGDQPGHYGVIDQTLPPFACPRAASSSDAGYTLFVQSFAQVIELAIELGDAPPEPERHLAVGGKAVAGAVEAMFAQRHQQQALFVVECNDAEAGGRRRIVDHGDRLGSRWWVEWPNLNGIAGLPRFETDLQVGHYCESGLRRHLVSASRARSYVQFGPLREVVKPPVVVPVPEDSHYPVEVRVRFIDPDITRATEGQFLTRLDLPPVASELDDQGHVATVVAVVEPGPVSRAGS